MEIGMGIHGEPGMWRGKLRTADAIAGEMLDRLLGRSARPRRPRRRPGQRPGRDTATKSCTSSTARVARKLAAKGVTIVAPLVGRYVTSMEMAGASITLCKLDEELEAADGARPIARSGEV